MGIIVNERNPGAGGAGFAGPIRPRTGPGVPIVAPAAPVVTRTTRAGSTSTPSTAITPQQRQAALNLLGVSQYNSRSTQDQLNRILGSYDQSDRANAALAQTDFRKNANLSDADRFAQAQKLQSSARGLFADAGNALQGSQGKEVGTMLNRRNRQDQTEAVTTLRGNQQDVQRTKDESLQANVNARRDAINNAAFALRGLESDYAAQLNNINPKLYTKPGTGKAQFGSKATADRFGQIKNVNPTTIGYYTTDAQIRGGYA